MSRRETRLVPGDRVCDGIAMGHTNEVLLVSRELIADRSK